MSEPPIVNPRSGSSPEEGGAANEANPFAPSTSLESSISETGRINLPLYYWVTLVMSLVVLILLAYWSEGMLLPGIVAIVAAAVRVPLLQRRQSVRWPQRSQPNPVVFLLSSWAFMLLNCFASSIAFLAICFPLGLFLFSTQADDSAAVILIGLSSLAGLSAFVLIFIISLRLPV